MGNPFPLKANSNKSFQGSIVLGKGFVLTTEEAQRLINKDPRNKDVLFPYLNGDDLNNDPEQKPSRWVINFFDWSEEKARTYPDCFEIVEHLVKPERMKLDEAKSNTNKQRKANWWKFGSDAKTLYNTISKLDQVMAINRHSKHLLIAISSIDIVYSEATVVFALSSYSSYAILSSSIHELWAWKYSSTMKGDTLRYSASNAFETFPFPVPTSSLENIGHKIHLLRREIMTMSQIGLTELQNFYHIQNIKVSDDFGHSILKLRTAFSELDHAILDSYSWQDIQLKHDFYEVDYLPEKDRIRFTVHPNARKEILKRLLQLNHELHKAETEIQAISPKKYKTSESTQVIDLFSKK